MLKRHLAINFVVIIILLLKSEADVSDEFTAVRNGKRFPAINFLSMIIVLLKSDKSLNTGFISLFSFKPGFNYLRFNIIPGQQKQNLRLQICIEITFFAFSLFLIEKIFIFVQ